MPPGPPPVDDDRDDHAWPNWREETRRLDVDDHEIRVIFEAHAGGNPDAPYPDPAVFGDFDPDPDGPDPDVWPLPHLDPGAPAPIEDLVKITSSWPAPHVAWVTEEYLEAKYGYNPRRVELGVDELPPWKRPDDAMPGDTVEITSSGTSSMTLTEDRVEALRRLARLWNGDVVRGQHLLRDKCPDWESLVDDLDQDDLERLFVDPDVDDDLAEAFADHDWFEASRSVFLKPQRILRKKVAYAPTPKARTLITGRDEFPDLRGDPQEGLRHRVTVGLVALFHAARGHEVSTYEPVGDYVVDVVTRDSEGQLYFAEVLTGHNNWGLHRETYAKLADLRSRGVPLAVFDSRTTAYTVLNHWHRAGLGELPLGPFNTEARIDWGREKIQEAYADGGTDWAIADWVTTDWLWRHTLGRDGLDVDDDFVTSLNW